MGVFSRPKITQTVAPAPAVMPAAPTFEEAKVPEEELRAREGSRRRAAAAMSTRRTMLSGDYGSASGTGKTLLGQ